MNSNFVLQNVKYVTGEQVDIVIDDGNIAAILAAETAQGQHLVDCSGMYVSSGWIDLHVHAFSAFDPYGDDIDEIGVKQGVTTIVDAGSCGANQISELIASSKQYKTNLLAFLNISQIGLERIDELSQLEWIDREKVMQAIADYPDRIVGLKARMSKSVVDENGIAPLQIARKLSDETALPLMVHIGSGPPAITEIVALLKKRDVITHYLNGKPNGLFDENGEPLQVLTQAIERRVHLDVGHGTASFSFKIAEMAKQSQIDFDTISTDIYRGNRLHGPVYNLAYTLTKFLYLGYSLEKIINAVTIHPAKWLERPELAQIQTGATANLTLFTVENKPIILTDSEGDQRKSSKRITAKGVVINGELITY